MEKSLQYAYVERRLRKRDVRKEWIQKINAAARLHGINYSNLIRGLSQSGIMLDRKILSELAQNEPLSFASVAQFAKEELNVPVTQANRCDDYSVGLVDSTFEMPRENA